MKKLIFLLILIPAISFSQESLKESAETFVTNFFKNWEDQKWDDILKTVSDDGLMIQTTQSRPLPETVKSFTEYFKKNVTDYKVKLYSVSAEMLSQITAFVTARASEI